VRDITVRDGVGHIAGLTFDAFGLHYLYRIDGRRRRGWENDDELESDIGSREGGKDPTIAVREKGRNLGGVAAPGLGSRLQGPQLTLRQGRIHV